MENLEESAMTPTDTAERYADDEKICTFSIEKV
jgi:hypothetical protein